MTSHEYLKSLRDLLTMVQPEHIKWDQVKAQMDKVIAENEPTEPKKKQTKRTKGGKADTKGGIIDGIARGAQSWGM